MENNNEIGGRHLYYVYSQFDPSKKICLYMPYPYFLSSLEKGELYFKKKKEFEDNGEKELPIGCLFSAMAVGENVPPQKVNHQEMQRRLVLFRDYSACGGLLTSCWTLREEENYFMWYVYAHKYGVRVMTTIEKFVTSIQAKDYAILCGEMMYKNKPKMDSFESNLFWKQTYYSDEKEFRFILLPTNENDKEDDAEKGESIPFNWNALESEVLLSPFYGKSCLSDKLYELENKFTFLQNVKPSKKKIRL